MVFHNEHMPTLCLKLDYSWSIVQTNKVLNSSLALSKRKEKPKNNETPLFFVVWTPATVFDGL